MHTNQWIQAGGGEGMRGGGGGYFVISDMLHLLGAAPVPSRALVLSDCVPNAFPSVTSDVYPSYPSERIPVANGVCSLIDVFLCHVPLD